MEYNAPSFTKKVISTRAPRRNYSRAKMEIRRRETSFISRASDCRPRIAGDEGDGETLREIDIQGFSALSFEMPAEVYKYEKFHVKYICQSALFITSRDFQ